ncbi:hypothetical protein M413DRAFT_31337 [Hebeloma cylindrosporum]|uniref:Uncharacterized protein n=1 Tax=Hebeloma cylindrosporum TaxID=76867 RepID=A0A0C2XGA3_HEBCY|nr:hypothetical protein M413DRAFT_31337 [Hebeloma cylindrosporum h7]
MDKTLPTNDLEGKDVQIPSNAASRDLNTAVVQQRGRGRVLLSMLCNEVTSHAAIALPESYPEAMAMAIDAFHVQIVAEEMAITELILKLGMKTSSGSVAWAPLRPDQWTDVVRDGDEIRLGSSRIVCSHPAPLIAFKCWRLDIKSYSCITLLLPTTSEELEVIIRHEWCEIPETEGSLRGQGYFRPNGYLLSTKWLSTIRPPTSL